MAESVNDTNTSLQYRLLLKRMAKLDPIAKARARRFALMQGLGEAADVQAARASDNGVNERLPILP